MIDTYNRLYANLDKKILYIKHNSCFDLIMQEVFPNMVSVDSVDKINHYFTFTSVIHNNLSNLSDTALQNLSYCDNSSICFIHEFICEENNFFNIQKILKTNNARIDIINCNHRNSEYLRAYTKYGIPYHDVKKESDSNKILIIGDRNRLEKVLNFLKKNQMKFDVIDKFSEFKHYNEFLHFVKKYKVVCSYNNIDLYVATSTGCSTIDLNKVIDAQGLLQVLLHCLQNPQKPDSEILLKLNFHMFKKDILNANNIKALM
ncbi:MAG: hypothetical protein CBC24_09620 [Candidatus Pelagibacter sp. TMED64]|nr:MAG: hypothetical protein CBC24_09620 [Candidatus Pelagibacter sp. TMED64]|tara:strand:- start:1161 stop:1940 length:780 start_codon:yes stop_codon:yes gene_type:complete